MSGRYNGKLGVDSRLSVNASAQTEGRGAQPSTPVLDPQAHVFLAFSQPFANGSLKVSVRCDRAHFASFFPIRPHSISMDASWFEW